MRAMPLLVRQPASVSAAIWSTTSWPPRRIGRRRVLGEDLAGEIGDRDADLGAAEVDGDDVGRIGHQLIGDGGAADMAAGAAGFLHPAFFLELAHDFGDGLLGQAGLLGDRGARDRPALDDRLHDGALRKLPGDTRSVAHGGPILIRSMTELILKQ